MVNRAVITIAPFSISNVGIYVHWNGGRASIEGFLKACRDLQYRDPSLDDSYAMARLTQVIGIYFGGSESLGIGIVSKLDADNGDNGTYVIGEGWEIVERRHVSVHAEEEIDPAKTDAIAATIVERITAAAKVDA